MRTLATATLLACAVALLEGCASAAERLADKCYLLGNGKAHVRVAGEALDVECK